MEGWIKLHRKSLESSVFQSPNLWQVWSYCLLRANHQEAKFLWNGAETILGAGQFITGRLKGSQDCNMNPSTFWKQIKQLEKINNISVKSNNKNSVITIVNWASYQGGAENRDNQMTTKEQQNDTDKNVKNERIINMGENFNIQPQFEQFWNLYDKKISKDKSLNLWNKLSEKEKEKTFDTLPNYLKATPNKQYRKNPDTYLRNKSWNDEIFSQNGYNNHQSDNIPVSQKFDFKFIRNGNE